MYTTGFVLELTVIKQQIGEETNYNKLMDLIIQTVKFFPKNDRADGPDGGPCTIENHKQNRKCNKNCGRFHCVRRPLNFPYPVSYLRWL